MRHSPTIALSVFALGIPLCLSSLYPAATMAADTPPAITAAVNYHPLPQAAYQPARQAT